MLRPTFWHESQLVVIPLFPVVCMASIQWQHAIEKNHWSKETMRYTFCCFSTDLSKYNQNSLFCNIHPRILNNLGEMDVSSVYISVHTKRSLLTFFNESSGNCTSVLCYKVLHSYIYWHFLLWPSLVYMSLFKCQWILIGHISWCCVTDCILLAHNKCLWKWASLLRSGNSHWVLYPKTVMSILCFMTV